MNVVSLTIQRTESGFSLIADVRLKDGLRKNISLADSTSILELKKIFLHFLNDPESLEVEVDYKLSVVV